MNIIDYGKLNISSGAGRVNNPDGIKTKSSVKADSFKKDLYVSAPRKMPVSQVIPVNNLYSPNQLLNAYSNPDYVKFLIDTNPELQNLMIENGIDGKVYPENITKVSKSHIVSTTAYALQIADKLNISQADKQILEQACTFHDYGKILVPDEILKKPALLGENEKKIMDLHSELGYLLLSHTGMNKRVLELIRNHHNTAGNADILEQILSVADIYSALREERSYKASMPEKESLAILDQKAQKGEVSTEVVNALKASLLSSACPA